MTNTVGAKFGGQDQSFGFGLNEIEELQRLCKTGLGSIIERVMEGSYYFEDIYHTIRLGLIGSGACSPTRATEIVNTYVVGKPLAPAGDPSAPLAVARVILGNALFGIEAPKDPKDQGQRVEMTDGSTSPQSGPLPSEQASAQ